MHTRTTSAKRIIGAAAATAAALLATAGPVAADPDSTETSTSQEASPQQQAPGSPDTPDLSPLGAPRLDGTYNITANYGTATVSNVIHFSSPCAGCDATGGPKGGNWIWTGGSWEHTYVDSCSTPVDTYVPVAVVNGYAQELTGTSVGMCGATQPATLVLSRIGA